MTTFFHKFSSPLLVLVLVFSVAAPLAPITHAAVSNWHNSADILPNSGEDFSSDAFHQSLQNLKSDGANYVTLVIPFYQTNSTSTDIQPGYNTPSDSSLASAIQYAHSIGLQVTIALYLETYSGEWRAYINPAQRDTWYQKYSDVLVHYAQIAQAQHAEEFIIGAELISMASAYANPDNTQRWISMIDQVRNVYSGLLSYSANRGLQDDWFSEDSHIGFWDHLDFIGISAYYNLEGDGSVSSLVADWKYIQDNDIGLLASRWHKSVMFTEVGYKSVSGTHTQPWNSSLGGPYDAQEQVNDFTALLQFWNDYSYFQGIDIWNWKTNPNAGGAGDTDYTPQNKPAEATLKQWWTSSVPAQPSPQSFSISGSASPSNATTGQSVTLSASITQTSGNSSGDIVDLEVYDSSHTKVFQTFVSGQSFTNAQSQTYSASWTPGATGTYTLKLGVFNSNWSQNYGWNDNAATIQVGGSSTTPSPTPTPNPSPSPSLTPTPAPTPGQAINIWWPTDGSHVSGLQPFKAMLENSDASSYTMYWSVDGGNPVLMPTNTTDYPHKEALVNLTSWSWRGSGPYTITFIVTDSLGAVISQKSIQIFIP